MNNLKAIDSHSDDMAGMPSIEVLLDAPLHVPAMELCVFHLEKQKAERQ